MADSASNWHLALPRVAPAGGRVPPPTGRPPISGTIPPHLPLSGRGPTMAACTVGQPHGQLLSSLFPALGTFTPTAHTHTPVGLPHTHHQSHHPHPTPPHPPHAHHTVALSIQEASAAPPPGAHLPVQLTSRTPVHQVALPTTPTVHTHSVPPQSVALSIAHSAPPQTHVLTTSKEVVIPSSTGPPQQPPTVVTGGPPPPASRTPASIHETGDMRTL